MAPRHHCQHSASSMASCQAAITPAVRWQCQPIASSSMAQKTKKKEEMGKKKLLMTYTTKFVPLVFDLLKKNTASETDSWFMNVREFFLVEQNAASGTHLEHMNQVTHQEKQLCSTCSTCSRRFPRLSKMALNLKKPGFWDVLAGIHSVGKFPVQLEHLEHGGDGFICVIKKAIV